MHGRRAGSDIGRQTAIQFAAHGARVVIADVNEEGARETQALIKDSGGESIVRRADVTSEQSVGDLAAAAIAQFGVLGLRGQCRRPGDDGRRHRRLSDGH